MLTIIAGAPFSGKSAWVEREIERREGEGEIGTLALDFTGIYSAIVPGASSVYRDARITDSGAARFAGWVLAAAMREANTRELTGYALTDAPSRAVRLAADFGGAPVVEVVVTQETALKRSQQHVEMVKALAPRAAADDGAAERCRKMVDQYFHERDLLPADTRRVTAPDVPSDRAIQYMWTAAIKAARRGDAAKRDKWTAAARRALAARGVAA